MRWEDDADEAQRGPWSGSPDAPGPAPNSESRSARWAEPTDAPEPAAEIESPLAVPLVDDDDIEQKGAALLQDRRRIAALVAAVVLLVLAIYVVVPKVVGLNNTIDRISHAKWYWLVAAAAFPVLSFTSYAMLFRAVIGSGSGDDDVVSRRLDLRACYQITFAGFAATALFSAAGAGGVALTYWALRKAGMARRSAATRMVTFLVVLYAVYLGALVVFGVLLRAGVLPGNRPIGGTIIPAAVGGGVLATLGFVALIPQDIARRLTQLGSHETSRWARLAGRAASLSGVAATGVRSALTKLRHPGHGAGTLIAALGWWAGNLGILWASFQAFGVNVPFGVVVQGYFVGMVANLAPSPAAGVGTVDAGLIGAFVLFGIPAETVFPAILTFRLIGFWLPIPIGAWAYVRLRHTVARWSNEPPGATIQSKVKAEAT